jgi:uncharacterized membrane protein YeaQ/YmgE (transglycosylase-associated protein family)
MTITASVIIVWLVIGLVIGALARLLVPGRQHIGIIMTILIGIVAALVGGFVTAAIIGAGHTVITFYRRADRGRPARQRVHHPRLRAVPQPQPQPQACLAALVER